MTFCCTQLSLQLTLPYIPTDNTMTRSDAKRLKDLLQTFYQDIFSEIKTSPLDPDSRKSLDQIYVNLKLISDNNSDYEENFEYEQIFERLAKTGDRRRMLFLGEAGVGKTTLLTKIVYDWAKGRRLQNIDILLYVPLRELQTSLHFGDIVQRYVSQTGETFKLHPKMITNYAKTNQEDVMLLLDGFDEYSGDIGKANLSNTLVGILRGDELPKAPVLVTTRPWRADELVETDNNAILYTSVNVEGFRRGNVKEYITKFYKDDLDSASSLVSLVMEDGSLVAESMAPFPIFCCMLCHMWKEKSRRETIQKLQTFSQLFREMVQSLVDQWVSKKPSTRNAKHCDNSLKMIGRIALDALLKKQLVFTRDVFTDCMEAMTIGCEVGVLSLEKKFIQKKEQQMEGKVSFPHKLFQEYLAGLYLSYLHGEDPQRFGSLLQYEILVNYKEFRYLLYFTAAHGNDVGSSAKTLIGFLRSGMEDEEFLMDVAFECQDEGSILPLVNRFTHRSTIKLTDQAWLSNYTRLHNKHVRSGYMYAWAAWSHSQVLR